MEISNPGLKDFATCSGRHPSKQILIYRKSCTNWMKQIRNDPGWQVEEEKNREKNNLLQTESDLKEITQKVLFITSSSTEGNGSVV